MLLGMVARTWRGHWGEVHVEWLPGAERTAALASAAGGRPAHRRHCWRTAREGKNPGDSPERCHCITSSVWDPHLEVETGNGGVDIFRVLQRNQ